MLYIVILNHQLSLVNEFVRIFYLLPSLNQLAAELPINFHDVH